MELKYAYLACTGVLAICSAWCYVNRGVVPVSLEILMGLLILMSWRT